MSEGPLAQMDTRTMGAVRLGPCLACRVGDHHLCVKVGCYGCPPVNHPRHHAAGNAEQATPDRPFPAGRGFEIQTLTAGDQ